LIRPGDTLAQRYQIQERIGKGGFSVVYRAADHVFKRNVAIKVVEFEDTESGQIFDLLGEARFIASRRHPNILDVYDFGQDEDFAYLVMPYADGGTLSQYLKKNGRLSLEETTHFLQQIASGLDFAHDLEIVHRDIKPQNILLFKQRPIQLVISDFGLAKIVSHTSGYTNTRVSGTPTYMAPEQISGRPNRYSDIYSLGVMLFQMLAGETPYKGEPHVLMYAHLHDPVPSLATFRPELPSQIVEIVARAMAKEPNERPHRAEDLYNVFKKAQADKTASAAPDRDGDGPTSPIRIISGPDITPQPSTQPRPQLSNSVPAPSLPSQPSVPDSVSNPTVNLSKPVPHRPDSVPQITFVNPSAPSDSQPPLVNATPIEPLHQPLVAPARPNQPATFQPLPGPVQGVASFNGVDTPTVVLPATVTTQSQEKRRRQIGCQIVVVLGVLLLIGISAPVLLLNLNSNSARPDTNSQAVVGSAKPTSAASAASTTILAEATTVVAAASQPNTTVAATTLAVIVSTEASTAPALATVAAATTATPVPTATQAPSPTSYPAPSPTPALAAPSLKAAFEAHKGYSVQSVAYSPDGKLVASGSNDRTVKLWDGTGANSNPVRELKGHTNFVNSVIFSPDGKKLASSSGDGTVRLWDVASGNELKQLKSPDQAVIASISFSPDGTLLAGAATNRMLLWQVDSSTMLRSFPAPANVRVEPVLFSPDGKWIAVGYTNGDIGIWSFDNNAQPARTLHGHSDTVWSLQFSPDSQQLISGSKDQTIKIWDVANPTATGPLQTLSGHSGSVSTVRRSADGSTLASGSGDGTVRLWSLTHSQAQPLDPQTGLGQKDFGEAVTVSFSPDGKTLVAGYDKGVLRFWDVSGATGRARPSLYKVQAGDTLEKIAQRFQTSAEAIKATNRDTADSGQTGPLFQTSGEPSLDVVLVIPTDRPTFRGYGAIVGPNNNLAAIARRHRITEAALLSYNLIVDPASIQNGLALLIPEQ
jgi:serine/threonine protein kinase/WD40 repeat protein